MIKEAIPISVLILFMRSREDPPTPYTPVLPPFPPNRPIIYSYCTVKLLGNVTLHREALLVHVGSFFFFSFSNYVSPVAPPLLKAFFSIVAILGGCYCSW